ncbi:hypothetical protein BOTBODRAFT_403108 [Botryobasidium botryosum FD-172 SS1]|uniref:Uncharacterized protein n=1 Tax=Botryobasidium botryosum (strain FD-172 SS1) TaxID=930990 RepID=A0A067MLW4_BOTB1|nr:hypothetical protein BOTBODRAFT_403108 [Botryobasidium botryosum FD-172 SS1]
MVYIDEDMVLKHLWRDTKTQMWTEQVIHVPITGRVVKFPAFLSQIRLSGSLGTAVANGHQVFLSSSEAAYAVVNDTSCRLEPTPRGFATDATGNLRVVIQARNELASPTITATLKNFNQSSSFTIQPRQRLLRQWGRFKSGSDLKNAKSTDGKPVFSSADKIDDASFDAVGGLLAKVPDVVAAVDPPSSVMITNTSGSSTSESSQVYSSHSDTSWMSGAQRVLNGIGDLLEVADFFAEIRGKVLRFTMDSVGTVIRSVAAILKQALGIDVTRVIALFGFMWDYENIKKTQKIIVKTCKDGVVVLHDALKANASDMKTKVKSLRSDISSFVKEPDDAPGNDVVSTAVSIVKKSFIGKLLDQIFDNPIIHEITRFISLALLKVISLLDDFITFPGFAKLEAVVTSSFRTLLEKLGKDQADTFTKILQSVFNQASKVAAGQADVVTMLTAIFTDVFWGLYEAAEDVILALLDLLPDLIACGIDILTGVIKWPGVSTFWESFTELPFSFVDVGSLLVAQITYLITMIWKGKLPFDVMQPWYEWLPKDGSAIKLFKVTKKDETTKSEDNAGSTTVAASALPQLRVVRAAAAASDSPAQDTKEEAQSPSGSWVTFMDIVFNFLVSCATCGASACTVGSGIVAASNLPPGYTPVRPNNAAASAVSDAPTSAGCASFMNAERIFTVFGLTAETASLVTACFIPPNDSSLRERTVLVKLLALVLKGIALSSQYAISSVNYTLPPLAPLVNDCLPPLANILNSLPPGIWAYSESEKNEAAKMALAISFENSIAAGCDIATNILSEYKQAELKWIPLAFSVSFNIAQGLQGLEYGLNDL